MIAAWLLSVCCLGWLVLVLCRVAREYRVMRGPAGEGLQRLVVLVRDRADYAEGLVRRLVAGLNHNPVMQAVLVDGGSSDETALILERLAFRFNLGFCRLEDLAHLCPRASSPDPPVDRPGGCRAACLAQCRPSPPAGTNGPPVPVRCLDLRHVPGPAVLNINLYNEIHFPRPNGG